MCTACQMCVLWRNNARRPMPWTKLRAKPSFLSYLDLGVGVLTEAYESFHALGEALRGLDDRHTHAYTQMTMAGNARLPRARGIVPRSQKKWPRISTEGIQYLLVVRGWLCLLTSFGPACLSIISRKPSNAASSGRPSMIRCWTSVFSRMVCQETSNN